MLQKISAEDCANKGVLDLPDTPQFTSAEMRRRFDELSREVIIPIHNQNIDTLCAESAGEEIGCAAPAGVVPEPLPEEGKPTKLLPVLKGIITYLTNAFQAWAYSKAETDTAIGQKIVEIGAGDMAKAVYDPLLKQKAVAFADEVEETYQPNADPSLQTSNKTVTGAINEVNALAKSHNILVNSNFLNPVNQQGISSYNNVVGMCIDRWIAVGSATDSPFSLYKGATNMQGYPTINMRQSVFFQITNTTMNTLFSISAKVNGELLKAESVKILDRPADMAWADVPAVCRCQNSDVRILLFKYSNMPDRFEVAIDSISGTTITPEWIKLEKGSVATPYVPKDFIQELCECMRYYQEIGFNYMCGNTLSIDYPMIFSQPLYIPMRIAPTCTIKQKYVSACEVAPYASINTLMIPLKGQTGAWMQASGIVALSAE